MAYKLYGLVFLSIFLISYVSCRPGGAPSSACTSLMPSHSTNTAINPMMSPPPYFIITDLVNMTEYEPNVLYNISLVSIRGETFRGFLIQARDASDGTTLIGTFIENSPDIQLLTCGSNTVSSVTHTQRNDKTRVSFQWRAPSGSDGSVDFRYSVVRSFNSFYANLTARDYPVTCNFTENTGIADFPLIFRFPQNCLREECQYYVGLGPNPSDSTYLDVYMEGNASGWIAIGFSLNRQMDNDDVLGCRVNSGQVTVVDTWNPSPRQSANVLDNTQNGLCVQSTSFTNGRITCRFSRLVDVSDDGQDYDLDDMYYLLFGRRAADQGSATNLAYHTFNGGMTPMISSEQFNPFTDNNTDARCPVQASAVDSHQLVFGLPEGCARASCQYFVGLGPNPSDSSYLDVYMEGNAAGWIAIGFSLNALMDNDDVLGCRVNSGQVTVVDTWNPSPRHSANVLDNTQNGLCVQSTSFTNGRIACRFSRVIDIIDNGRDYNLNNSFRLLFGRRAADQGSATNLAYHTANGGMTPTVSAQRYNPVISRTMAGCPPTPTGNITYTFTQRNSANDYFFGARVNPDNSNYLDIRLEATVSGWVGIGFSLDPQMGADDVLACHRSPSNDMVTAVDTWNPIAQYTDNVLDPNQDGLCPYTAQFTNGRIICTFSRFIAGNNPGFDRDLRGSLFQLYATSTTRGTGSLSRHNDRPTISSEAVSVINATGVAPDNFPRVPLTKVHGILMILAWPFLVVSAIFFAAWMKPALPNGEWFQIHRAFMIVSLVLTALGFLFIFVANAKNTAVSPGLISFACGQNRAHFAIGFIVFILQIINPIMALFRCKPTDSKRWIFNIFHGSLVGFSAEILALINVGLGIALFESGCGGNGPYRILWVYIAFVVFLLLVQLVMFIVFTIITMRASPENRKALSPPFLKFLFSSTTSWSPSPEKNIEMTDPSKGTEKKSDDPPPKKEPSEDASIRWGGFGVFIIGTFVLIVALVIMIAINN